ncbi:MAG: PepSY domain-containing protein [Candidatus Krumholzibacteriota bacterium]
MTEKQMKSGLRSSHRWVGALAAVLLFLAGASGFLLQHPSWLGPAANPTFAVAADPVVPGRLLRGTHWGVEESTDQGLTWREIDMLAPPTDVVRVIFAPDDPRLVHALGRDALVRSRDGGRIWQEVPINATGLQPDTRFLDLGIAPGGVLYLLTDDGLLGSSDGGLSWDRRGTATGKASRDWRGLIHDLHTGHILGATGRRIAETGALALLFITVTGLVLLRRNGKVFRR